MTKYHDDCGPAELPFEPLPELGHRWGCDFQATQQCSGHKKPFAVGIVNLPGLPFGYAICEPCAAELGARIYERLEALARDRNER